MKDYKIDVSDFTNEMKIKVQKLAFELGYRRNDTHNLKSIFGLNANSYYLGTDSILTYSMSVTTFSKDKGQEITIKELEEMVRMKKAPKREDKVTVEMTLEQAVFAHMLLGHCTPSAVLEDNGGTNSGLEDSLEDFFGKGLNTLDEAFQWSPVHRDLLTYKKSVETAMDKIFTPPKTEGQKKIEELEESIQKMVHQLLELRRLEDQKGE